MLVKSISLAVSWWLLNSVTHDARNEQTVGNNDKQSR